MPIVISRNVGFKIEHRDGLGFSTLELYVTRLAPFYAELERDPAIKRQFRRLFQIAERIVTLRGQPAPQLIDGRPKGDRLREIREHQRMTQGELGAAIGVSGATISAWEQGRNLGGMLARLDDLARALDCEPIAFQQPTGSPIRRRAIPEKSGPRKPTGPESLSETTLDPIVRQAAKIGKA